MKLSIVSITLLLAGLVVGFILGKSSNTSPLIVKPELSNLSCTVDGTSYKNGESFKNSCNICSCENGQVACTLMACADDTNQ